MTSNQATIQEFYMLYRNVVEEIQHDNGTTNGNSVIAAYTIMLTLNLRPWRHNFLEGINFENISFCCGYLLRYATCHSVLIKYVSKLLFAKIQTDFSDCWKLLQRKHSLNVVSVGGGPGDDIISFCSALSEENIRFQNLKLTVVDLKSRWKDVFLKVMNAICDKDSSYSAIKFFKGTFYAEITPEFITADAGAQLAKFEEPMENADVVLLVKVLSWVPPAKKAIILRNIMENMKEGSIFLYVDIDSDYVLDISKFYDVTVLLKTDRQYFRLNDVPNSVSIRGCSYEICALCKNLKFPSFLPKVETTEWNDWCEQSSNRTATSPYGSTTDGWSIPSDCDKYNELLDDDDEANVPSSDDEYSKRSWSISSACSVLPHKLSMAGRCKNSSNNPGYTLSKKPSVNNYHQTSFISELPYLIKDSIHNVPTNHGYNKPAVRSALNDKVTSNNWCKKPTNNLCKTSGSSLIAVAPLSRSKFTNDLIKDGGNISSVRPKKMFDSLNIRHDCNTQTRTTCNTLYSTNDDLGYEIYYSQPIQYIPTPPPPNISFHLADVNWPTLPTKDRCSTLSVKPSTHNNFVNNVWRKEPTSSLRGAPSCTHKSESSTTNSSALPCTDSIKLTKLTKLTNHLKKKDGLITPPKKQLQEMCAMRQNQVAQ